MSSIKLVIFDLDGTIADTIYDLAGAAEYMCRKYGDYRVSDDLAKNCIGNGLKLFLERVYKHHGIEFSNAEKDVAEFKNYYFDNACIRTKLYDDTLTTLETIKNKNIHMAVATMKPFAPAMKILEKFNISSYFEVVVGGDTMPEPKPSPLIVDEINKYFKEQPDRILVVGDGMTDVNMAISAGVHSVALLEGYGNRTTLENSLAEYKFTKLGQIIDLL